MIWITGDKHGDFSGLFQFNEGGNLTKEDLIIILGDAGINYYGDQRDSQIKEKLSTLACNILCIHGNHEQRASSIKTYKELKWKNGTVYMEPEYPNLLFAKDGEIFNIGGHSFLAIGGAYSVDKHYRLAKGWHWWPDEQPSKEIKQYTETQLNKHQWTVDYVLSHTCPISYEPTEAFIDSINQSKVDKSTEIWLGELEKKLDYDLWFCGHYHIDKKIANIRFMFYEWLGILDNVDGDDLDLILEH